MPAIIHLDMDAFFASVEVLDNPELRDKPVIVGGNRQRGVVSAASYEARKFGIHSAMPMAEAMRRCPDGLFMPPRLNRYREVSARIFRIFERFTPLVEPLSLDEAFLDVNGSIRLFGPAEEIAQRIRKEVHQETGLTVSAGVAGSKLIAKIASDYKKPDGLTLVRPGDEEEFLAPLPVKRLWGVGPAAQKTMTLLGVRTIGDLRRISLKILTAKFGKQGDYLYHASRGIDCRPVRPRQEIKSMGHEETFAADLIDLDRIHKELLALAEKTARRLRSSGLAGRTLTLKVKYHDFQQVSRSITLDAPIDDAREIWNQGCRLLDKTRAGRQPVRLLGLSLSQLKADHTVQLPLFPDPSDPARRRQLNTALDRIKDRFGTTAILPGALLDH
ncbi:MAG: DNA polymerase IV [Desulfobacterales bacterium]|nr:DNA polymerase IV [Desulfobacterales bacterium]